MLLPLICSDISITNINKINSNMRKLLLFFAMLCVSIGAWAMMPPENEPVTDRNSYLIEQATGTWHGQGPVVVIHVKDADGLKKALAKLSETDPQGNIPNHLQKYQNSIILKIDSKSFTVTDNGAGNPPTVTYGDFVEITLSDDDKAALGSVVAPETIDLQDLKSSESFTFTNQYVKSVILPNGWTKAQVKAAGEALAQGANFGSCFSQSDKIVTPVLDDEGNPKVFDTYVDKNNNDATGASLIAYVAKSNTLHTAVVHSYFDQQNNAILGTGGDGNGMNQYNDVVDRVKSLTVMGYPAASDFSSSGDWDENGHFVPNCEPYEHSSSANAGGVDGTTERKSYVDGTKKPGGIAGGGDLLVIDLSDAVIYEEYNSDLTLSWTGTVDKLLEQVWLPTSSLVKTIPADFLSCSAGNFREICIPSNIEYIKTRAFGSTSHNLVHVWTTGTDDNTVYDNGAYTTAGNNDSDPSNDVKHFGMSDINTYNDFANSWGTYTFSPNLKCIESFAFSTGYRIKDVYCLGTTAPECHVDAFTQVMYNGNNTYDQSAITDGIITREAYTNNKESRMYMTMLHYPKTTTTPNIQRYTDPTREYNVATGERDGKGNTLYFPNQSEFCQAYDQGTTGYLWDAWPSERTEWGDLEIVNGSHILTEHTTAAQTQANQRWTDNPSETLSPAADDGHTLLKHDRSFYDVTLDGNGNSTLSQPSGLDWYYNTVWEGSQLYPKPEITEGDYIYEEAADGLYVKDGDTYREWTSADGDVTRYNRATKQGVDEQGYPMYEQCSDGTLVQEYTYRRANDGGFVRNEVISGYSATNTPNGAEKYFSDNEGTQEVTPLVGNGFYYVSGTEPVYTAVDKNNDAIGAQSQYYTKNGDTYAESNLMFNNTYYYPTGETIEKDVFTGTNYVVPGVDAYYSDAEGTTPATPGFYNTYYYNVQSITRDKISSGNWLKSGVTKYYSDSECTQEVIPTITSISGNGTLYYKDSEGYHQTNTFIEGQGDYYVSWGNPNDYQAVGQYYPTVSLDATYYYKDGEETVKEGTATDTWVGDVTYYKFENNDYVELNPQINGTYYYKSSTETVDEYIGSAYYVDGKSWYSYDQNNKTYTAITLSWYNHFTGDYYYVSGERNVYSSAANTDYNAETTYYTDQNGTEASSITFDKDYYTADVTYSFYKYNESTDAGKERWEKVYTEHAYREYNADKDDKDGTVEPRYCPYMVEVKEITHQVDNDFRGWHQFVLAGYGKMSKIDYEPVRWWISDNDWWTICEPYDLKYSDLVMFFGTEAEDNNGKAKIPYLSKLMYVVRDVENEKITLTFSKNLMEYKEMIPGTTNKIDGTAYKHGTFSDDQKWSEAELAQDPVILHAGVPYLIKPNMTKTGTGEFNRQFDIFANERANLWSRLVQAQNMSGSDLMNTVYKGEYTVPAYVVGEGDEGTQESLQITNKDNSKFNYASGTIKYNKKDTEYKISTDFTYTFVGSFFKSVMPKFCYFLGWDSKAGKAAFWFNRKEEKDAWNWNNETGIICPNFNTDLEIDPASGLTDPARWIFSSADIKVDDFESTGTAKSYTMDFGATNYFEWDEATGVSEMVVKPLFEETKVYDTNGRFMGSSLQNLPKGVYIVNGKKYIVK